MAFLNKHVLGNALGREKQGGLLGNEKVTIPGTEYDMKDVKKGGRGPCSLASTPSSDKSFMYLMTNYKARRILWAINFPPVFCRAVHYPNITYHNKFNTIRLKRH